MTRPALRIPESPTPAAVAMVAAALMPRAAEDREAWLDIYDRAGYIVSGRSLRQIQLDRVAVVAVDLAEAVLAEMTVRHIRRHEQGGPDASQR
jgi:hypothetical protein